MTEAVQLTGAMFIGGVSRWSETRFAAWDPASGAAIEDGAFSVASLADVADACACADAAFLPYLARSFEDRARFLEAIADAIDALGDGLIERAMRETGLPTARLVGERARTTAQLRLFAATVRDGGWQARRHDPADPARVPPKPELRLRKIAVGPVAVFGASNFPLAFSVAGGDTAAALAAGCPVVVKAHPAHPGTSELVATAVLRAAATLGMPDGVFSMLGGPSHDIGTALVADPRIRAVGFTGSRSGGIALMKVAAARPVPIPVYAEMSSINPVVLMPAALAARGDAIADGFVASLTMGAGQFCTNPGLVLAIEGPALDRFLARAAATLANAPAQTMLSAGIHQAYQAGRSRLAAHPDVRLAGEGLAETGPTQGRAALFELAAGAFIADPRLAHEVFGATALVIRCRDLAELGHVIANLEGQLTATLHADDADHADAIPLIARLEHQVGRILVNGWPTGVEVSPAMVHGGPFPATSDGRSTSVGTLAIDRFLRPVCYQSVPDALYQRLG